MSKLYAIVSILMVAAVFIWTRCCEIKLNCKSLVRGFMFAKMTNWETVFEKHVAQIATLEDPAHDLLHFRRVVATAKRLNAEEGGDPAIVIPAAWLHDLVIVSKGDPRRAQASQLSAEAATTYLKEIGYNEGSHEAIAHAIAAHSFSAGLAPKTLEAAIVQDADRLDGLGAIGIARCFATSGLLKRQLYNPVDAFCEKRTPNDAEFTVDHFFRKLFVTAKSLKTGAGRREGDRRISVLKRFLNDLREEI